ncbi:MAG: hypothetical protein ACK41E_06680, partial [Deinococcales bacterium]
MKITHAATLIFSFAIALAACGQPANPILPVVPPRMSSQGATHPTNLPHTLVQRFYIQNESKREKEIRLEPSYRNLKYQPRYSQYPGYIGWDSLTIPTSDSSRSDWLVFKLNRPAVVALVWNKTAPWLLDWMRGGDIPGGYKSYKKTFPAGEVKLPSPGKGNPAYELLLAEENGTPSGAPALPPQAPEGATVPQPNQTCPDWLHRMYSVTARDGNNYGTWHPQIDPVYWCYFRHEHGADPALIGYNGAALEYVAKLFNDQAEIHEGFKSFVIRDETSGVGWYISVHA